MRNGWFGSVVLGVVIVITSSLAFAQIPSESLAPLESSRAVPADSTALLTPPHLSGPSSDRQAELVQWIDAFTAWQAWSARWANRAEPGVFTSFRDRQEKPAPPAWLADQCLAVFAEEDPLVPACARLAEWRQDNVTMQARQTQTAAVTQREDSQKTTWLRHVNFDLLWPAMQAQTSTYGVVGMHLATPVVGRLEIFTAPGVILLNLPSTNGQRVWAVAANYGIGYRVANFIFPGGHPAALHVNLAKSWLLSDAVDVAVGRSIDFIGFSITFNGHR